MRWKQILIILISTISLTLVLRKFDDVCTVKNEEPQQTTPSHLKDINKADDKIDWHDYKAIRLEKLRTGPGEHGAAVNIPITEATRAKRKRLHRINGYDTFVSDSIALNRSVIDFRHKDCWKQKYRRHLPSVSIIIPFHEEHLSPLLRTFVSAVERAPPNIIKEVILVDDCSQKPILHKPLDDFIASYTKAPVRVVRLKKRSGAIIVRQRGAEEAKGEVLIFLDSHTEAGINWLPPLLEPVAENYRTVVCPMIDIIDLNDFHHIRQNDGVRGAFSWVLNYKHLPLLPPDLLQPTRPYESPVMAGGLFAVSRKWFFEFGGYDTKLEIWGGEQYDLSFKIWMCGGRMVDAPCSRFAHIYRIYMPYSTGLNYDFLSKNYVRIIETWFGDYKEYVYLRRPFMRKINPGDLTEAKAKRARCKSFDWYMKHVAFDLPVHYPYLVSDVAKGQLRNLGLKNMCAAIYSHEKNDQLEARIEECKSQAEVEGSQQNLFMSWRGEITALNDKTMCFDAPDDTHVTIVRCHKFSGPQRWTVDVQTRNIKQGLASGKLCLDVNRVTKRLTITPCRRNLSTQRWEWQHLNYKGCDDLWKHE